MKAFGLHQCLKIRRILSEINKTFSIIYILYGTLLDFVGLFKACKIGARMLIGNRKESRSWKNVWILFKNKINKEEFIQFKNSFIKIGTVSASKLFSKVCPNERIYTLLITPAEALNHKLSGRLLSKSIIDRRCVSGNSDLKVWGAGSMSGFQICRFPSSEIV